MPRMLPYTSSGSGFCPILDSVEIIPGRRETGGEDRKHRADGVRNAQSFLLVKYAPTRLILTALAIVRQGNRRTRAFLPPAHIFTAVISSGCVDPPGPSHLNGTDG
jgi:hypothetical protein